MGIVPRVTCAAGNIFGRKLMIFILCHHLIIFEKAYIYERTLSTAKSFFCKINNRETIDESLFLDYINIMPTYCQMIITGQVFLTAILQTVFSLL